MQKVGSLRDRPGIQRSEHLPPLRDHAVSEGTEHLLHARHIVRSAYQRQQHARVLRLRHQPGDARRCRLSRGAFQQRTGELELRLSGGTRDRHQQIRPGRELVDFPGAVLATGAAAGLIPVERCVALLAGLRDGMLVARPSFFQLRNLREARTRGKPWHLIAHEDVLIFRAPGRPASARGRRAGHDALAAG